MVVGWRLSPAELTTSGFAKEVGRKVALFGPPLLLSLKRQSSRRNPWGAGAIVHSALSIEAISEVSIEAGWGLSTPPPIIPSRADLIANSAKVCRGRLAGRGAPPLIPPGRSSCGLAVAPKAKYLRNKPEGGADGWIPNIKRTMSEN